MNGVYGLRDVCLSVPTEVGCGGVRKQIELPLTAKEKMGLLNSSRVLRETIQQVEERMEKKPGAKAAQPVGHTAGIPRSAWQRAR
jgi:L-lactate dehydrogenase